jgi:hypothetical protein
MEVDLGAGAVVQTLSGCGGTGLAGISQLADVPGRQSQDGGGVEIRIILAGPPAGRSWVVRDPGQVHQPGSEPEISFTGWLGLLRALYEVTVEPGPADNPGPDTRRTATGRDPPGPQ